MPSRPKAFRPGCPIRGPSNLGASCPKASVPRPGRPKTPRPWKVHPKDSLPGPATPKRPCSTNLPALKPSGSERAARRRRHPRQVRPKTSPPQPRCPKAPWPQPVRPKAPRPGASFPKALCSGTRPPEGFLIPPSFRPEGPKPSTVMLQPIRCTVYGENS